MPTLVTRRHRQILNRKEKKQVSPKSFQVKDGVMLFEISQESWYLATSIAKDEGEERLVSMKQVKLQKKQFLRKRLNCVHSKSE